MLPREHRLRNRRDFQRVFREGRAWAHPLLALHVTEHEGECRAGIVTSRKVGGAVTRNRVRRQVRALLGTRIHHWKEGWDIVIVARSGSVEAGYGALLAAVDELARRARLPREPEEAPDALYRLPSAGRSGRRRPESRKAAA